jgi:membrane protease YdiL (CAAX protease family)
MSTTNYAGRKSDFKKSALRITKMDAFGASCFQHCEARMTKGAVLDHSRNARHWGVLGTILWGTSIAIVFVVIQTIFMVAYLSYGEVGLTDEKMRDLIETQQSNGVFLSFAVLLTTALCVPLILGVAKLKRGSVLGEYLAFKAISLKAVGQWLVLTVVVVVILDLLTAAIGQPVVPEFMKQAYASADPVWLLWLAFVVAAPLSEELFFRGFLFKGLERAITPAGAIVVTAAIWASIHLQYDIYGIGAIFILGLLLGAARYRSNSILPPLAMHALANVIACGEAAFLVGGAVT